MCTRRHVLAFVLLAVFTVGGVLVPSVHAVHHIHDDPHAPATAVHVIGEAHHELADCQLCEAVFQGTSSSALSISIVRVASPSWVETLSTHWNAPLVALHAIRGPPQG